MSVCLAVVRGLLTPEQARAAILGRSVPEPVLQTLRLTSATIPETAQLSQLPPDDRDRCLDLFKQLYDQPPAETVLAEDATLAGKLVEQRLVAERDSQECLAIQRELHAAGVRPLPRIGELLVSKGFLRSGRPTEPDAPPAGIRPIPPASSTLSGRQTERPPAVLEALKSPANLYGRYVRTELLGEGGAGEVWKSWDLELERWVALKFLKYQDIRELARLKEEAQTAARLSHPHISVVHEIAEAKDRTFLVLEYIQGQTLDQHPKTDHRALVSMVRTVAQAIHYAHERGVIHRDLKPGNIMVDASGRPWIMDFGLARSTTTKDSLSGQIQGTPSYMSPEQALGRAVDPRSDVYSLGALLYELLAGRPPFQGQSTLEILHQVVHGEARPLPGIAGDLRTIIFKCLMKEPSRRYASARDLAEDLRRWHEGEAILAHPPSLFYRLRKKAAKYKAILAVGGAGILLASAVAGWILPRLLKADRKGVLLTAEKEERDKAVRALDRARPYLDEGRKLAARLDRLLTSEQWTPDNVHSLTQQAAAQFDRALDLYPEYPDALLEKARILQSEKQTAAALEYCGKAIQASRGYATAYLQRARIRLSRFEDLRHPPERMNDAMESSETRTLAMEIRSDLQEVQAWSKDTQELNFATGALLFVDGDYEKAAPVLEEYSGRTITDTRVWEWTGRAWLGVPGMEERAIRAFSEAVRFRPGQGSLRLCRGFASLQLGRWHRRQQEPDKAAAARVRSIEDFQRARDIDPRDWRAHWGLGEAALDGGEGVLAAAHFTHALEDRPGDVASLLGRARARLLEKDYDGALADADLAFQNGATGTDARVLRGRARLGRGDLTGAREDLEQALREDSKRADALVGWGDLLWEGGDPDGALREYSAATMSDPGCAESYLRRGELAISRGEVDRASVDLAKAMALDPANPGVYYALGIGALNRHEWTEALTNFRSGLARKPSAPEPFWHGQWLARARAGSLASAQEELARVSSERSSARPDCASSWISRFLLGRLTQQDLLGKLQGHPQALAEAYFYSAEKDLLEGKADSAAQQLNECLKRAPGRSWCRSAAAAELRSLPRHP